MKERKARLRDGETMNLIVPAPQPRGTPSDGRQRFNVQIYRDGSLEIWPQRSRDPSARVLVTVEAMYQRALMSRVPADAPRKRRVKRGLLSI